MQLLMHNMISSDDSEFEYLHSREEELRLYTNFYFRNSKSPATQNDDEQFNKSYGTKVQEKRENATDNCNSYRREKITNITDGHISKGTKQDTTINENHLENIKSYKGSSQKLTSFKSKAICVSTSNKTQKIKRRQHDESLNISCQEIRKSDNCEKKTSNKCDKIFTCIKQVYNNTTFSNVAENCKLTNEIKGKHYSKTSNGSKRKRNISVCSSIESISGREPLDNLYCGYFSDIEILDPVNEEGSDVLVPVFVNSDDKTSSKPFGNINNVDSSDEESRCSLGINSNEKLKKKVKKQKLKKKGDHDIDLPVLATADKGETEQGEAKHKKQNFKKKGDHDIDLPLLPTAGKGETKKGEVRHKEKKIEKNIDNDIDLPVLPTTEEIEAEQGEAKHKDSNDEKSKHSPRSDVPVNMKQKLKKKNTKQNLKKIKASKNLERKNTSQDLQKEVNRLNSPITNRRELGILPISENKEREGDSTEEESRCILGVNTKQKLQDINYDTTLNPSEEIHILPTPLKHIETVTVDSDVPVLTDSDSSDGIEILQFSPSKAKNLETNHLHGKDRMISRKPRKQRVSPDATYLIASSSDDEEQPFSPLRSLTLNISSTKTSFNRCIKMNSVVVKSQAIYSKVRPPTQRKPGCMKWSQEMSNMYDSDFSDEFSVQEIHCMQSDTVKNWKICRDDILGTAHFKNQRYFKIRCTRCRDFGHTVMQCPRIPHCLYCGSTVHKYSAHCPERCCLQCGQQDHRTNKNCSKNLKVLRCSECRKRGHNSELCPDLWRRFHLTTKGVTPVKPSGNFQSKRMASCYNCAGKGHYGHQCQVGVKNSTYILLSTQISSYNVPASLSSLATESVSSTVRYRMPEASYQDSRPQTTRRVKDTLSKAGFKRNSEIGANSLHKNIINCDDGMKKIVIYPRKQMKKLCLFKKKLLTEIHNMCNAEIKPRFSKDMDTMTIIGNRKAISTAHRMMEFILTCKMYPRPTFREMKKAITVNF